MRKAILPVFVFILLSAGAFYAVYTSNKSGSEGGHFNKTQYSLTDPASIWVIINKQHPLITKGYVPRQLVDVGNGQKMQAQAASQLAKMLMEAKTSGYMLSLESGFRSYNTQAVAYNSSVTSFGQRKADEESARAGYSEHQTGLSMDFGSEACKVQDCIANTAAGRWLATNSFKYGFILRYPPNKASVTGYKNEAWHYRYVGRSLAEEMHLRNITTLEEFFGITGGKVYL